MIKNIRNSIRGYNILKNSDRLNYITLIREQLCETNIISNKVNNKVLPVGSHIPDYNIILKQFLLINCITIEFNRKVLVAIGSGNLIIKHPLPYEWRLVLEKNGFIANTVSNKLYWLFFVIKQFVAGIISIIHSFLLNIGHTLTKKKNELNNYVYFDGLIELNLPHENDLTVRYNLINWFLSKNEYSTNVKKILHSVKNIKKVTLKNVEIYYLASPVLPIHSFIKILKHAKWAIISIFYTFFDLLRFNYTTALLLKQANFSKVINLSEKNKIATSYYFHNSNHLFRPLWTYEAEKKGSKVYFFFYSTNCETFKKNNGYPIQENNWQLITWHRIIVWDTYQRDFIKRCLIKKQTKAEIEIVGSIWFADSYKEVEDFPCNFIAVFDVQPMRMVRYHLLGLSFDYYNTQNSIAFIDQIYKFAVKNNLTIIYKKKRNVGTLADKTYQNFILKLAKSNNFKIVNPDISAHSLIEKATAVISMPFTSTAIIAKELDKPSVFFDPNNLLQKDDRAAHGIEILYNSEELENWFLRQNTNNLKNNLVV